MSAEEAKQLKLKALQLKQSGDIENAKKFLAQARAIEFDNVTAKDLNNVGDLKRLAVHLKNRGDIEGAKEALLKSKQLEAAAAAGGGGDAGGGGGKGTASSTGENGGTAAPTTRPISSLAQQKSSRINEQQQQQPPSNSQQQPIKTTNTKPPPDNENQNQQQQQPHTTTTESEPTEADIQKQLNPPSPASSSEPITFDDDEMTDYDTMSELQSMGMDDDMPSESDYYDRIKVNKLEALQAKKRGDMMAAKKILIRARQLEAVCIKLYAQKKDGDGESDDEDEDEDYSLLEELKEDGDNNNTSYSNLFGAEEDNILDLDELDQFDAEMLKDMMEAGMQVPDPDDILQQAYEKKILAKSLHKEKKVSEAKMALMESKKLQFQGEKLAQMLEEVNGNGNGDDDDDMDALMAMLEGGNEGQCPKKASSAPPPPPPPPPEPTKTAQEWKIEAVKNKQKGNIKEATKALQMYKQAMIKEAEQAELEKRKQVIKEIKTEIELAVEQTKRFSFYQRFVDVDAGNAQLLFWKKYRSDCTEAISLIESKGTGGAIAISRTIAGGGKMIRNDDLEFVGEYVDPDDNRLEVAILDVMQIQHNKNLKKAIRHHQKELKDEGDGKTKVLGLELEKPNIRVDVVIQLPPSEHEGDDVIQLHFEPEPRSIDDDDDDNNNLGNEEYNFNANPPVFIDLPRGKSKYAKTIRRRMERKRIKITVVLVPIVMEKGLFGGWKKSKEVPAETVLGSITIDLKEFLRGRVVCGDFPLMDSTSRNELGGMVRLGIRTGMPFDMEAIEDQEMIVEGTSVVDMEEYSAMVFAS